MIYGSCRAIGRSGWRLMEAIPQLSLYARMEEVED